MCLEIPDEAEQVMREEEEKIRILLEEEYARHRAARKRVRE